MIGAGIVKINRLLYQALAQHLLVEIEIGLWIAGNGRDMVDAVHKLVLSSLVW
jgi:hypothetical protein